MEFHPEKCKLLRITNNRKIVHAFYSIHSVQLEKVDQAKYLGLTITKNFNWNKHINNTILKATNVHLQKISTTSAKNLNSYVTKYAFVQF